MYTKHGRIHHITPSVTLTDGEGLAAFTAGAAAGGDPGVAAGLGNGEVNEAFSVSWMNSDGLIQVTFLRIERKEDWKPLHNLTRIRAHKMHSNDLPVPQTNYFTQTRHRIVKLYNNYYTIEVIRRWLGGN